MISNGDPIFFKTSQDFQEWLLIHADTTKEIWIGLYKKKSGMSGITYKEALDVALCFGWIDGLVRKYDKDSYMQRFTPRTAKSVWSKINTHHVERLIKEGKMKPQGMTSVELAKKDGRWDRAYAPASSMKVPEDFMNELKKHTEAFAFFQTLNRTNIYAIVYRLDTAKKPETRSKRIGDIIDRLARGIQFH